MLILASQPACAKPTSLLESALDYAKRYRLSIIPVIDKQPACPRWKPYQTKRPRPARLRKWFSEDRITGLAVICGQVSGGLVCRDFDEEHAYLAWRQRYSTLADALPTVRTKRGYHVYIVTSDARYHKITKLADGELRGNGYCLIPPSNHPEGATYQWVVSPNGQFPAHDPAAIGLTTSYVEDKDNPTGETELYPTSGSTTRTLHSHPSNPSNPLHVLSKRRALPLENITNDIDDAIISTLPTGYGQRNQKIFQLARHLKAIPSLAAIDDVNELMPHVQRWHQLALNQIRTKDFHESWNDFITSWENVKQPAGATFAAAVERAKAAVPSGDAMELLIQLCSELQSPDGKLFLGCREAGKAIGVSHVQAWSMLKALCRSGVLQLIRKGTEASGRASEYRFCPER